MALSGTIRGESLCRMVNCISSSGMLLAGATLCLQPHRIFKTDKDTYFRKENSVTDMVADVMNF